MTFPPTATRLPWLTEKCRLPEVDGKERVPGACSPPPEPARRLLRSVFYYGRLHIRLLLKSGLYVFQRKMRVSGRGHLGGPPQVHPVQTDGV